MPARHRSESGFALLLVFVMAATVGIMLYLELPRVAFEAQRQREELLIERGEQYKRAIQLYVRKLKKYPATLDELEKSQSGRFLRRRYKDPMTGKDEWRLINIDAAGNFTNSLTQKPPAEGEKKAENLNTFIGEGPPIGGGAAVPGQPQGGAALAAQRRPSDRPLMPASNIPGLPGQPAEQFQAGGAPPPPYGTAPAQPQPYPVAVYPQAQPGQPQPYPYSNLPGQPYPQQTSPGYTPPPGYPTAPGAQPGVPPGFPGQPQPTQIQPGFPGQPQAYPAPAVPGQAPVPFIPGFPGQPQNPQGQPQAYPSPQQPGYPTAPQYGSAYPIQPASSQTGGVVPAPFPTAYPTQPGTGGAPAGGGSPFGQPGTRPGAGAPNPALEMIQRALISPRPGGLSGQSGFGSQVMGGGIAGVASTVEAEGIKVYNEHTKYNEWEFIYDPKKDRTVMGNVAGVPGQGLAAGQGSPERTTEPSKFGTSFGSQEGQPQREPGRSPRPRRRR